MTFRALNLSAETERFDFLPARDNKHRDYTKLLLEKFGGANSSLFQHCFRTSADCQCSNAMMKEVEDFVCTCLGVDEARTLHRTTRQIIESIQLNEQLLNRNADVISEYLTAGEL